jgi:hypothetical protein
MGQTWGRTLVCVFVGACAFTSRANGQDNNAFAVREDQAQEAGHKAALAESIIAREESASGRAFDRAFRAGVSSRLAAQSLAALESQRDTGAGGLGPKLLGDSQADLVYTPVTPCRIIDTRIAGGQIAEGTTRNFRVTGSGFAGQGGVAGSCGVPVGPATAAVINLVAVAPAGAGDLRVTPFGTALPTASIINYAAIAGLNIANGPVITICNPAVTTCTSDFTIQADVSATHLVADVQGFFQKADLVAAAPIGVTQLGPTLLVAGQQFIIGATDVALPAGGSCLVTCQADVQQAASTGPLFVKTAQRDVVAATDTFDPFWGNDGTFPSARTSAGKSHVWSMTAGTTYRFGCWLNVGGDYVGKFLFSTVTWICR